jgi:hypothetical protein
VAAGASLGCVGDQIAEIEATSAARGRLFAAEEDWTAAMVQLADVLTDRAIAGKVLTPEVKSALRIVRDAGERSLTSARGALARGATGEPFQSAVADLEQSTHSLVGETRRLRPWIP